MPVANGSPFSSICGRCAPGTDMSPCIASSSSLPVLCLFARCAAHTSPSPRQAIGEKYERLLSAAPAVILDCSSLFDGRKVVDVIENAVSKHAGIYFCMKFATCRPCRSFCNVFVLWRLLRYVLLIHQQLSLRMSMRHTATCSCSTWLHSGIPVHL